MQHLVPHLWKLRKAQLVEGAQIEQLLDFLKHLRSDLLFVSDFSIETLEDERADEVWHSLFDFHSDRRILVTPPRGFLDRIEQIGGGLLVEWQIAGPRYAKHVRALMLG